MASSPAASRPPYPTSSLGGFSTSPTSYSDSFHSFILLGGSSSPNLLSHFMFGQTRSETKTLDSADLPGELLPPLTPSFFFPPLLGRLILRGLPSLLGISLSSPWIPPFPLHALALIFLFLGKVRLSPTLSLPPPS